MRITLPLFLIIITSGCGPQEELDLQAGKAEVVQPPLRVLSYNTFIRKMPTRSDNQACRAVEIGKKIKEIDADIVALTEIQDPWQTPDLLAETGYQDLNLVNQPTDWGSASIANGGLGLLTRLPVIRTEVVPFEDCHGWTGYSNDCLAAKGFIYALLEARPGLLINVLVTHLDAGTHEGDRAARESQLKQIHDYIQSFFDSSQWPTLILGDLNVNGILAPGDHADQENEYATMLRTLTTDKLHAPVDLFNEYYDKSGGKRYSQEAGTMNCLNDSIGECQLPGDEHPAQRLDYMLHLTGHDDYFKTDHDPGQVSVTARSFELQSLTGGACDQLYLSDHKALVADLELLIP